MMIIRKLTPEEREERRRELYEDSLHDDATLRMMDIDEIIRYRINSLESEGAPDEQIDAVRAAREDCILMKLYIDRSRPEYTPGMSIARDKVAEREFDRNMYKMVWRQIYLREFIYELEAGGAEAGAIECLLGMCPAGKVKK